MNMYDADKTRMIGLAYGDKNYDDNSPSIGIKPFSSNTGSIVGLMV